MKAYLDSFLGLIPCKVLGWYKDSGRIAVRITARSSALEQGAILHYSPSRVIPRENVSRRPYGQIRVTETDWSKQPIGTWLQDIKGL